MNFFSFREVIDMKLKGLINQAPTNSTFKALCWCPHQQRYSVGQETNGEHVGCIEIRPHLNGNYLRALGPPYNPGSLMLPSGSVKRGLPLSIKGEPGFKWKSD